MKKLILTAALAGSLLICKAQTPDYIYHNKKGDFTLHCKDGICDTIWTDGRSSNKPFFSGDSLNFVSSSGSLRFVPFSNYNVTYIRIDPADKPGKYIIHFKKSRLKWLNDSTAVYIGIK